MGNGQKTCFVIMGFGEKTDFQSNPQRMLNLNKTYEYIIEPAVKEAGLKCVRADQIIHSTVIDKPMYENLLDADVVVADLSTSNANAIYELGVRHALKPTTTIVIAENNFSFPFDPQSPEHSQIRASRQGDRLWRGSPRQRGAEAEAGRTRREARGRQPLLSVSPLVDSRRKGGRARHGGAGALERADGRQEFRGSDGLFPAGQGGR